MGPDHYFILIYNIPSRQLEVHGFEENYPAAVEAYDQFEREHRNDGSVEVVLVGADSIETIHKTHSHYFAQHADDLFRQFLEGASSPVSASAGRVIRTSKPRRRRRGS
jgi:acylphosphatase